MNAPAAADTTPRLKPGDSVSVFTVTDADDRRLRLAVSPAGPIFMLVLGAAALLFDIMLLHAGFRLHVIRIFPKIIQVILIFMPLLALFGLFSIGQSFDFNAAADRVVRRRFYRVTQAFPARDVAALVLKLDTPTRDTVVELQLLDRAGKVLLKEFREDLGGTSWPPTLHLAADLARLFRCPIRVDGEIKEAWPAAKEAIEEAGPRRMRPVLMTQLATVFGMIPVAISTSQGAEFRNAMGVLIIGGILSSTFLTLLIVPVAYTLMADLYVWRGRAIAWIRERFRPTGTPAE